VRTALIAVTVLLVACGRAAAAPSSSATASSTIVAGAPEALSFASGPDRFSAPQPEQRSRRRSEL